MHLLYADISLFKAPLLKQDHNAISYKHKQYALDNVITALHGMQTRSSDENYCLSVLPSVFPTNAWIVTKRKKNQYRFYTTRKIIYPSFLRKRMIGRGDPFYLKFWVNRPPLERNHRF